MKQMTKKEAYDFLKNTKVKVTPDQSRRIQEIVFKAGIHWIGNDTTVRYTNEPYLLFDSAGIIRYLKSTDDYEFEQNKGRELNALDILDIEIIDDANAVNHPSHYNNYSVEVLEMMRGIWGDEKVAIFCELNAFKYRMRMGLKEGNPTEQDLAKEKFYLEYINKLNK